MPKSVYIHIPFCRNICTYCDFCKMFYNEKLTDKYLSKLKEEIEKKYNQEIIHTIYIGGGTPSSLNYNQMKYLLSLLNIFKIDKINEITIEINPDIEKDILDLILDSKINRISIGVETFDIDFMDLLNRKISYRNIEALINYIKKKGVSNINIDLIYGMKNQNLKNVRRDLDKVLSLDVPHISTYCLIKEKNTILDVNGYEEESEEMQRKMYYFIKEYLEQKGYSHYEISNFAKNDYYSWHNLVYWDNKEYYGFGLGASGFINNCRYTNTKSINKYLNSNFILEEEIQSEKVNMENFMILGLRKIKGVKKKDFFDLFHKEIKDVFDTSKLKENEEYFYIDSKDLFISNEILLDFIGVEDEE